MSKGATTTTTTVPEWQKEAYEELYAAGRQGKALQFNPYTGEAVAQFTPDELASFENTRGMSAAALSTDPVFNLSQLSGANPFLGDAAAGPREVSGGSLLGNISPYMNEFNTGVMDRVTKDIEKARLMQTNQNADKAFAANAFGGDRLAVENALTNQAALEEVADASADLYSRSFDRASELARGEADRNLEANLAMAGFDQRGLDATNELNLRRALLEDASMDRSKDIELALLENQYIANQGLLGAGGAQRGLAQDQINFEMGEFDREQNQFANNLGLMTSAFSGVPFMPTTSTQKKTGFGDILNAGVQLGAAFLGNPNAPLGSDKRMKTNIKKLGTVNGINIYSWTWNKLAQSMGWDKKYQYNVGVMAQEVQNIPNAVSKDKNGYLLVNYSKIFNYVS